MAEDPSHFYHLSILTPEKTMFEGQVYSIIAPGADGYFEILANHASLLALIKPGKLTLTDTNDQKTIYAVTHGFLEVSHNQVSLLIDAIEKASEIDLARAQSAHERALQRLTLRDQETDLNRAKKALEKAINRINIFQANSSN